MAIEMFEGRPVEIINSFDLVADRWVVEFRDPALGKEITFLAINIPESNGWEGASVSINPDFDAIPVRCMLWAIEVAQAKAQVAG